MLKKTFANGRMNKDLDERLLGDGDYRDAINIEVVDSEGSDVGAIENSLSTKQLTNVPLGPNPVNFGKYEDETRDNIYWFEKSDTATFLLEYDAANNVTSILLKDTRTSGNGRVLDLKDGYRITGIVKIISEDPDKDLLMWTDDQMEICCINIERAKTWGTNGFSEADIFLIKPQPKYPPEVTPTYSSDNSNYVEELFVAFGYRYRYLDGERSAISSYSYYQFSPKRFRMDYHTRDNLGMVNNFNAVKILFDTGPKQVTDIEIIGKHSNSNNLYLLAAFNKELEGWGHNQDKDFIFSNNKIYTTLAEKELYRTFDNVPRAAKALALIENTPVFGNYLEGYDIEMADGSPIKIDFVLDIESNDISGTVLTTTLTGGNRNLVVQIPSTVPLDKDHRLILDLKLEQSTYDGSYDDTVEFIFPKDFSSASQLANDPDFEFFIETVLTNNFLSKYDITVDPSWTLASNTPFSITASTATSITIQAITLNYNISGGGSQNAPFTYLDTTEAVHTELRSLATCKTNMDYEAGLIYQDKWGRKSTVLIGTTNTIYIPQKFSTFQNLLTISINNTPPYWADTYKVAIKAKPLQYHTMYANLFYAEGVYRWVKLEGQDKDKVKEGDFLIVKSDLAGSVGDIVKVKVLEIKEQEKDFIADNQDDNNNDIIEESGLYMKIKPSGFKMDYSDSSFEVREDFDSRHDDPNPTLYINVSNTPITSGARITILIESWEKNKGDNYWSFDNTYTSTTEYPSFEAWYNAEVGDLGDFEDDHVEIQFQDSGNTYWVRSREGGYGWGGNRRLNGVVTIQNTGLLIFETEPKQAESAIFFETSETFDIVNGRHMGNVQDQVIGTSTPAVSRLGFFNAYVMGNGAESYRVKDAVNTNYLNIDLKPTTTSIEQYKATRRFADLTYGEPYIESTNFNGLNVFNASMANFKELDKQDNSIQFLFSRDTNVIVFQEDKVGYVMFGKDLIRQANGDVVVTAVPEILGGYVPFTGQNGCGKNPESIAWDAYRIWYVNPRRGTPIRLSMDGTSEINYGMVGFFRDLFIDNPTSLKLGGFDPYHRKYALTAYDDEAQLLVLQCGQNLNKIIDAPFSYVLQLNSLLGEITINYDVYQGNATIEVLHDGNNTVVSNVNGTGTINVPRNDVGEGTATVTITPVGSSASVQMTNNCPVGTAMRLITIVKNSNNDIGTTIINRFKRNNGSFYSENHYFDLAEISKFTVETGAEGVGKFPANGETVTLQSFKDPQSTGQFSEQEINRLGFLVSTTLYNQANAQTAIDLATFINVTHTQVSQNSEIYGGSFVFNRPSAAHNLYLIWDYSTNNQPPVANPDSYSVNKGQSVTMDVLANDTDPENDPLTPIVVTQPQYGTLTVNPDKTITYTHDDSDNYSDSFTYRANDGTLDSNIALVEINVGVDCSAGINASGNVGIYEAIVVIGTGTGNTGITFDAFSVPDRFQIEYDGNIVADSLYRGDALTGDPPTASGLLGTHTDIAVYNFNGTSFDATGETRTVTVAQSDVAPVGQTDGNGSISFYKATAQPTVMKIIVTAPTGGTAWNLTGDCPDGAGLP